VKCPGVADVFRIPKLGASFYQAQVNPKSRIVIQPNFYWDFANETPGKNASIFSNCERLELYIDEKIYKSLLPDSTNFPHIKYPPFFVDLDIDGSKHPELRIDGYIKDKLLLSKSYSSDSSNDKFFLKADELELFGNGSDASRVEFKVVDKFNESSLNASGKVTFTLKGPGEIVGDNPFFLKDSGGVGSIWVKTLPGSSGEISIEAAHSSLGTKSVVINIQPENITGTI
jgi:beta-galactosidase